MSAVERQNEMEMKRPVPGTLQKAGTSDLQKVKSHYQAHRRKENMRKQKEKLKSVWNKLEKVLLAFFSFLYFSDLPKYFDLI